MKTIINRWERLISDTRSYKKRFSIIVWISAFLSFSVFFFAPVQIYLNNTEEFWFRLDNFLGLVLIISMFAFMLFCIGGSFARGLLFDLIVCSMFGVALVFYLQGNFLNISYGRMNGEQVDWSRYGRYALINTLSISALLLVPFLIRYFIPGLWNRILRFVSVMIIGMQIVGIIALYIPYHRQLKNLDTYALGWEGASLYSREHNNVLIIVDSFDQIYFEEYLHAHPEIKDTLDGFTDYRNTAGISSTTVFSMTPMLTGKICKWEEGDFQQYLRSAWEQEKFISRMKESGYLIYGLTNVSAGFSYIDQGAVLLFDNAIKADRKISNYPKFLALLYSLSFYTFLPHVLKPGFWLYPGEFNYLMQKTYYTDFDPYLYEGLGDHPVSSNAETPTFHLYHILAMHPPLMLTAEAEWGDAPVTSLEAEEGSFRIVDRILDQMKSEGVYDASTIIIAADHMSPDHTASNDPKCPVSSPLLLYKPRGVHGTMETEEAPASLFDIRATFLKQSDLTYQDEGIPLDELSSDMDRVRYFYRHMDSYDFYEMVIKDGDANEIKNYQLTGTVFSPIDEKDRYAIPRAS